ncbi:MAG: restriction endonuclease subunit S, partial [Clostridia bacterium]|nr:restriction endonuclease subunit S [Clostridia bacterium]
KYLMQQIFAQKLRFADFTEEWEVKKLGDIVEFLDNKRIPLNEDTRNNQKDIYPYYGASGIIDYVEDYIFDEELILIGEDGTIDVNLASGKYWVSNHAHVLRANDNINQYYLTEFLKTVNFEIYNTGTIQPKLNKETCKTIPIRLPNSLEEQNLIANCFFEVNTKMGIFQNQIFLTKKFKEGLLQQMFI